MKTIDINLNKWQFSSESYFTMNQKQRIYVQPTKLGTRPELCEPPMIISEQLLEERDVVLNFDEKTLFHILVEQGYTTENFSLEFVIKNEDGSKRLPLDKRFNTQLDTEREICIPISVLQKSISSQNSGHWIVATIEQYLNVTHKPTINVNIIDIYTDLDDATPECLIFVRVGKFKTSASTDLIVLYPFLDEESKQVVLEIHPEIEEYSWTQTHTPKESVLG